MVHELFVDFGALKHDEMPLIRVVYFQFGLEEVQPKQLFLLPSDHLHKTERILMISPFERRPHYYLISTSLSLVLLDDRCPNRPVSGTMSP